MSLINQMLKDLESRHRPNSEAQDAISGMVGSQQGSPRRGLMLSLITIIVLMGATLGYLLWPNGSVPAPEQLIAKAVIPETVAPETEQNSPSTPKEQAQETTNKEPPSTPVLVEKHKPTPATIPVPAAQQPAQKRETATTHPTAAPVRKAEPSSQPSRTVSMQVAEDDGNDRIEKRVRPLRPEQLAERHYQAGYRRMQQGDHRGAEAQWQKALEVDPMDISSREALAALYLSEGRRVEASEQLQQGLDYHPGYGQFALLYARLQMENGNNSSAIAVMEKALQEQQQPADFYAYLAAIYQHSKDYAKSIAAYQRALNLKPKQSVWWMGIGISLEGAGKPSEAITAYREALNSGRLTPKLQGFVKGRLEGLE